MSGWKTVAERLLVSLVILSLAAVLASERLGLHRPALLAQAPKQPPRRQPALPPAVDPPGQAAVNAAVLPIVPPPAIPAEVLSMVEADEKNNTYIYAAVNKSVVNITTAGESGGFFGDDVPAGTGSGFVIDKQGHILTNYHVVERAESVQVTFFDGSNHEAAVIGTDASNDVAVVQVKVPPEHLVPVSMGDSSKVLVGQKILALGNPFGLERTLTTGIVSALDRSLRAKNGRVIKGVIQTDAAINPGNSGGPLLNSRGQVIGMNTAIVSQVGQSAGISFAVPINAILRILKPLIEHGRVIRADLGITRVFTTNEGLVVIGLVEGGPAERGGIRPIQARVYRYGNSLIRRVDPDTADTIVAIDGKRVTSVDDLLNEVEAHAPGESVSVTVIREGRAKDLKVTLGES